MPSVKEQRDAPWWKDKLSALRERTRTLFHRAKNTRDYLAYKWVFTGFKNKIMEAKRQNFISFCKDMSETFKRQRECNGEGWV